MKWYNIEIPYNTEKAIEKADNFKKWLKENGFKYEPSACFNMVHIEILASEKDLNNINNALDSIVWC